MELKFKKLSDKAILPIRAHSGDAGLDLTAVNIKTSLNECGQVILEYYTGLAVEIPEGYVGLLFPRSSIFKKSLVQTNSVGVIDSGYRGEIIVKFRNTTDVVPAVYQPGEKIAQLVIVPIPELTVVEAEELSEGDRGEDSFGSTGTTVQSAAEGPQSLPEQKDESINSETATGASGEAQGGLEQA